MVLLQAAYDSTSQHQHSAHLPQGNASSIFTQLLQTCLGPRLYFYIAVVNSCSWLCLKILRNKLIHFCMLSQPACLMPVGIRSTLILGSFRLRVSAPTQHKPLGQEMLPPALGSVLWCAMSWGVPELPQVLNFQELWVWPWIKSSAKDLGLPIGGCDSVQNTIYQKKEKKKHTQTYQKYYFLSCRESNFKWFHLSLSSAPCSIGWILLIKINFKPTDHFYLQGFAWNVCGTCSPPPFLTVMTEEKGYLSYAALPLCATALTFQKRKQYIQIPPPFSHGTEAGQASPIKVSHSTLHRKTFCSLWLSSSKLPQQASSPLRTHAEELLCCANGSNVFVSSLKRHKRDLLDSLPHSQTQLHAVHFACYSSPRHQPQWLILL